MKNSREAPFTQQEAKRRFDYNPNTGELLWKIPGKKRVVGAPAGCKFERKDGYRFVVTGIHGHGDKRWRNSRIIWLWMTGEWPDDNEIDHIDNDGWNNRWENLRKATHSQNAKNLRLKSNNTSGFPGVSYDKRRERYRARITVDWKEKWLGYFETLDDAVKAYRKAAVRYHGEFAGHLNAKI